MIILTKNSHCCAQKVGIEIWRVENRRGENDVAHFGIRRVPKEMYRQFYRGDSYILMNTYATEGGTLRWDIHFWIGSQSTADEYGVAAYKARDRLKIASLPIETSQKSATVILLRTLDLCDAAQYFSFCPLITVAPMSLSSWL